MPPVVAHGRAAWGRRRCIVSEGGRGTEVDVRDLRFGQVGLDMREYPYDPGHGPDDVQLLRADQRYVDNAELARRGRREVAVQIRRRGEPDADQVVRGECIALQDGGEQLTDLLVHVPGFVPLQLDGAADRSYRHGVAPR